MFVRDSGTMKLDDQGVKIWNSEFLASRKHAWLYSDLVHALKKGSFFRALTSQQCRHYLWRLRYPIGTDDMKTVKKVITERMATWSFISREYAAASILIQRPHLHHPKIYSRKIPKSGWSIRTPECIIHGKDVKVVFDNASFGEWINTAQLRQTNAAHLTGHKAKTRKRASLTVIH